MSNMSLRISDTHGNAQSFSVIRVYQSDKLIHEQRINCFSPLRYLTRHNGKHTKAFYAALEGHGIATAEIYKLLHERA